MNIPAASYGVSIGPSITFPKVVTLECLYRGSIMVSSVVSPVETPIEAFGNDRLQVWQQLLRGNGAVFVGSNYEISCVGRGERRPVGIPAYSSRRRGDYYPTR